MNIEDLHASANDPIWDGESTKGTYQLPLPPDEDGSLHASGITLSQGIDSAEVGAVGPYVTAASPQSHIACFRNAIDFLISDGTPVLAMGGGTVIEVVDSNTEWGDGPEYRDTLNYLTIEHPDGEYSQYCHLAASSATVRPGDTVTAGQQIATVGKTGWTDRDHLHVVVFRGDRNQFGFKSLKISFS